MDFNMRRSDDYEKIKTVGKGAFGTAVLYRKKSSGKLVVLKEINTADLSAEEREMALNEVAVISSLNHENIIGYGGSFIENGVLMIEMEFADGGTLSQLLNNRETYIPEKDILNFLRQISSAISHMHKNNILHRDLKTANVFLNSDGVVKIGDFGISKILSTSVQAHTVLGTPYYISPEMCEGKEYGEKSDIWAMGCILYEICCLHRAFQASSLSGLVNKIMQGDYKPVPSGYSKELRNLISILLEKNPNKRPSAQEVIEIWIPKIMSDLEKYGDMGLNEMQLLAEKLHRSVRSVLYEIKYYDDDIDVQPVRLPPKIKVINMASGNNHYIVVTDDNLVFAWGEGENGQLGSREIEKFRHHPSPVLTLKNKNIIMAGAGENFSIFLSSDGKVWSCGNGKFGALGHGDWNDHYEPKIIDFFTSIHIKTIQCSLDHVGAISDVGTFYMWGCGNKGQIGNDSTNDVNKPTIIELSKSCEIFSLHLGFKATMLITMKYELYACGWNEKNRLGLFEKARITKKKTPIISTRLNKIKCLSGRVINCSIGETHCALLLKMSHGQTAVFIMGCVRDSCRECSLELMHTPIKVSDLDNSSIQTIKCGPTYTAITMDNCVLLWGVQYKYIKNNSSNAYKMIDILEKTIATTSSVSYVSNFINKPTPILGLYASKEQLSKGSYLLLSNIYPLKYGMFVLVETTASLIKENNQQEDGMYMDDSETTGNIAAWIKSDIMQSKFSWTEN